MTDLNQALSDLGVKIDKLAAQRDAAKAEAASLRAELLTAYAQAEEMSGKRAAMQAAIDAAYNAVQYLRDSTAKTVGGILRPHVRSITLDAAATVAESATVDATARELIARLAEAIIPNLCATRWLNQDAFAAIIADARRGGGA